jgi:hypothetical protein
MGCSESYLSKTRKSVCAGNTRVKSARRNAKSERSQQADGEHHQRVAETSSGTAFGRVSVKRGSNGQPILSV